MWQVFAYMLDPGPIVNSLMQHYERQGLVETYDFRMSRRMADAKDINDTEKCRRANCIPLSLPPCPPYVAGLDSLCLCLSPPGVSLSPILFSSLCFSFLLCLTVQDAQKYGQMMFFSLVVLVFFVTTR